MQKAEKAHFQQLFQRLRVRQAPDFIVKIKVDRNWRCWRWFPDVKLSGLPFFMDMGLKLDNLGTDPHFEGTESIQQWPARPDWFIERLNPRDASWFSGLDSVLGRCVPSPVPVELFGCRGPILTVRNGLFTFTLTLVTVEEDQSRSSLSLSRLHFDLNFLFSTWPEGSGQETGLD